MPRLDAFVMVSVFCIAFVIVILRSLGVAI